MLLDTDQDILTNYEKLITSEPTRENLEACGCVLVKEDNYGRSDDWKVIYRGECYEFTRYWIDGKLQLKIYCKHYTNSEKTAWLCYGSEYAKNFKELLGWIDAEIKFYKDHPEEKEGTPEYENEQKRRNVVTGIFDELRWKFNYNYPYCTIGYYPKEDDDMLWYSLYAEACKIAKQEHPELFEK